MLTLRESLNAKAARLATLRPVRAEGVVTDFAGLALESLGPAASVGDVCEVECGRGSIRVQVIGFRRGRVLSMPLEDAGGLQPGARIRTRPAGALAPVGDELLGRVLDGFGRPLDGKGPLGCSELRPLYAAPIGPMQREPIHEPMATGVRSIDALIPCGKGQRVGIFGGSGVGKSTLLAAMARNGAADVNVIAMIGERNREVRAFLEENLDEEGLRRSVVVAATSDRPAPVRVRAAFLAAALADSFREQGRDVLLIMDSVTRMAMAQREIGLAAGEPPSQKGYTPSVFQLLPQVFERAGNFDSGSVTAFYTVLVEGDDMNEPIADAVRSLLDGHIVLSRELAQRNHYPAIDVLQSVSRLQHAIASEGQLERAGRLREALAEYQQSEDLVRLGAYAAGSNPKLDAALRTREDLVRFLKQNLSEPQPFQKTLGQLMEVAGKLG
ncbi:MAG: FliI/YscN family ATPase [Bryobacterales bacterium]